MKIAILGGGQVGYYLAGTLIERGHHPRIIEQDRELCQRIANQLDIPVYCGDGTIIEVLESAGLEGCDDFIAVTGSDEVNLVACQLAKKLFGIPSTVARVNNPKNVEVMERLGVDAPVSSTTVLASIIEREVDPLAMRSIMSLNRGNASINEILLPKDFSRSGEKLMDLELPAEAVLVSITRGEELIIPRGNVQLFGGDRIILVAQNHVLHRISQLFELE